MADVGDDDTAALVGATGGAGTTRLTIELAALLANDGRDVAVFDAAFATQGLSDYLPGRIDPDLTALLTDNRDAPLAEGLVDFPLDDTPGRLACCPTVAPFERLARAKSPTAAQALETRLAAAADRFDHVLVDTPPVAANQSVAAVTAAARTVVVAPASTRGRDAVQRTTDRLDDVDVGVDAVVTTQGELSVADAAVPETEADVTAAPTCLAERSTAAAVADVADIVFDVEPSTADGHGLLDSVGAVVETDFLNAYGSESVRDGGFSLLAEPPAIIPFGISTAFMGVFPSLSRWEFTHQCRVSKSERFATSRKETVLVLVYHHFAGFDDSIYLVAFGQFQSIGRSARDRGGYALSVAQFDHDFGHDFAFFNGRDGTGQFVACTECHEGTRA